MRQASKPKTTAVLLIKGKKGTPPLDPQFVSSLYSPSYGVRVIALATSEEDVEHALPRQQLHQSYHIRLRPLAFRAGEIEQVLDRLLAARGAKDHPARGPITALRVYGRGSEIAVNANRARRLRGAVGERFTVRANRSLRSMNLPAS